MIDIVYIILISSIIQGLFEWIPISSSGIVTIFCTFLGIKFLKSFNWSLALHLGSGFAAFTLFWRDFLNILKIRDRKACDSLNINFSMYIILIFISLLVGGLLYILLVKFYSYEIPGRVALGIVGIFLIITGLLDYYYEKVKAKVVLSSDLSRFDWFILGFLQGIAVIPGLSRSGLLLAYLSFRKVKPDVAFKISLIVGAPTLILAGLAGLYMCRSVIPTLDIAIAILLSYITSLLFGYLFYRAFMRLKVWSFAIIIGILLVVSMLISLL